MGAFERDTNDRESVPQPTESTALSSTSDGNEIVSEPVPKKRKNRARRASIAIFSITAILVLAFCFTTGKVVKWHGKEIRTFPDLFTTALGLLSIVLGTLVDRLSLVFEECHHLKERYGGSRKEMIKACFSGIQKGPVIILSVITLVIIAVLILCTGMPFFELRYLVTIFGGIGVGPLVMHLLSLNTQSTVHISTILEERGMYVANGLAWSYYFNYLKEALPIFKDMMNSLLRTLSLNKLLLLIPLDCYVNEDLNELDQNIEKLDDIGNEHQPFRFPVYRLTTNGGIYNFAIIYVKEPLKTLDEMSKLEHIKAVKRKSREAEVKLLIRTLSQIIEEPPDQQCRETCLLLPIKTPTLGRLKNGGLADAIMNAVKSFPEQTDGALKPGSSGARYTRLKEVNVEKGEKLIVDLDTACASNKLSKRNAKQGTKTEDTQDSELITNNKQRNMNSDFDENAGKRGKCLQRKYKEKKTEETELKKMIPAENTDPSNTSHNKTNVNKQLIQEVGGNEVGAGTSGHSSQAHFIADGDSGSLPSDQDEDFPSDDEHKRLHTSQL